MGDGCVSHSMRGGVHMGVHESLWDMLKLITSWGLRHIFLARLKDHPYRAGQC